MLTLAAGLARFRQAPAALIPMTVEGMIAGVLIAVGILPHTGASAGVGAVFPLDVFFDLKQTLAQTPSWAMFALAIVASVVVRSGVLAATLAVSDGSFASFFATWKRTARLVTVAAAVLLPSAVLMFSGMASRYAPFIWAGALLGFFPALALVRKAMRVDAGAGPTDTKGLPEGPSFLAYAYALALFGAAMSSFGEIGRFASAAIVIFTAPFHALVFLGWREHARNGTYPGGGTVAVAMTAITIAILLVGTVYDRVIHKLPPVGRTDVPGSLLLLGGVDSTSETGALTDVDVRHFGFSDERWKLLSYRGPGQRTTKADTHRDLSETAAAVAEQIEEAERPISLLGHSQAALILDRLLDEGLETPDRSVVLAPPPPFPPALDIPPPGESGPGKPGGDAARFFAAALGTIGLDAFDVDAEAFPTNLRPVVIIDSRVRRLSVWALGDSVWLDRDWRRPGELNVVALTDHVGIVNNGRAISTSKAFYLGQEPEDDEASWRGAFVSLLRHVFAPWRPADA